MADDVARMLADLGIERRELVSTPMVDSRGREVRADAYEEHKIAVEAENRRKAALTIAPSGGLDAERAARIHAWNSECFVRVLGGDNTDVS